MAKLIISVDGRDKVYEIIDERFTIGSGQDADLKLRADGVSGVHLTVDKTKAGYRIVDMETKEGTIVNGKPTNQHTLANGDTIQIGSVKITYMGKGPAKAGGAAKKKTRGQGQKLESKHYYRHAQGKKTTPGAQMAIIGSIVVGVILVLWIGLKSTQPPEEDRERAELTNAIKLCDHGLAHGDEIEEVIQKYNDRAGNLDNFQLKQLQTLRTKWKNAQDAAKSGDKSRDARAAWMKIHNVQMAESSNRDKLRKMCEEFVATYSDTPGKAQQLIRQAKAIMSDLEAQGEMTPDEKEFARIEEAMREPMRLKDHHAAMRVLKSMNSDTKAGNPEKYQKLHRSIRLKSRQFLTTRKNDVKGWLRKDEEMEPGQKKNPELEEYYDPAKARQLAIDTIMNKLLHEVIEDYLDSPDKYRSPWNQKAEERTQDLLRQLLKDIKPNY